MKVKRVKVQSVKNIGNFNDEFVYDIGINNEVPYFFGNDILVHNSSYFSAYNTLIDAKDKDDLAESLVIAYEKAKDKQKQLKEEGKDYYEIPDSILEIADNKDAMLCLYDEIADETNKTFAEYMDISFNTGIENGKIIAAGRELVGTRGLFITKKRYAILKYDDEGKRLDKNNSPGKIKAMGLDLKRSDTPKYMQEFLEEILMDLLSGHDKQEIIDRITEFRSEFRNYDPWMKGSPKKVNGLTKYSEMLEASKDLTSKRKVGQSNKVRMPGHVRASINWNFLKKLYNDYSSMSIQDGQKVIVCKLRKNPMGFDSVAYPFDEHNLPQWFKDLPFDEEGMEEVIIDKKIDNLLGILKWNLDETKNDTSFGSMFSF